MSESSDQTKRETILVVDDEAEVRSLVREILQLNGFEVIDTGDPSRRAGSPSRSRSTCCSPTW